MNRYFLALALSAVIPVSILDAQIDITPTFVTSQSFASQFVPAGFEDPSATSNGILNANNQAEGYIFDTTPTTGTVDPAFTYALNVGQNAAFLTDFDLFNVVGTGIDQRLTTFDLLIVDSSNTPVFSQDGITESSLPSTPFGTSINVDLSSAGIGTGDYAVLLTDRSGELNNRAFSEIRFSASSLTTSAVPEPTSGVILGAMASLALLRRRKR